MIKVCITGATGLLGQQILKQLLKQQEYHITALYNNTSPKTVFSEEKESVEWKKVDLNDVLLLEECIRGKDIVIHTAALVSFKDKDKEKLYKVNIEGTANIVNICLTQKTKKFCYISSVAAIGRSGTNKLIDEKHLWEESEYTSNYAKSKYLAELEVWRAAAEGLKVVIINPSVILGIGDGYRSSTQIFHYIWKGGKFYTNGLLNYVDVRDVARITIKLIENEVEGERFILNAGTVSYKSIFEQIAKYFSKSVPKFHINNKMLGIFWRSAKFVSFFTRKSPVITREIAQNIKSEYQYDNTKIKESLSYNFYSLEETLRWSCEGLLKIYSQKNQRNV